MIFTSVKLAVHDDESKCNRQVTLYRGDEGVQIQFILVNNYFEVKEHAYAQLIIGRPSASALFTSIEKIQDNTVTLTIAGDMIDELKEVGEYQFQIRLYDDALESRVTLPPCSNGLIIRDPMVIEDETIVGRARVNDSIVMPADEFLDIFDENDNYVKTDWTDGDRITETRLDKIEDALYEINAKTAKSGASIDTDKFVTIEQLENYVTDDELENYVTDEELKGYAKIDDLGNYVTDEELSRILSAIDEPPVYNNPTANLSVSPNLIEQGKDTSIRLSYSYTQNDGGPVDKVLYYVGSDEVNNPHSINSTTQFKMVLYYTDGPIKNTSLGNPYPATSIKSGSITKTVTVTAIGLSYYGVGEATNTTLKNSKSFTWNDISCDNNVLVYKYPKSLGLLTSIKDANNFDYINSYTRTEETINGVSYYVYTLTDAMSITGFKQIYS